MMARVMACCLIAPSHCLNQISFSLKKFCGIQLIVISKQVPKPLFRIMRFEIILLKLLPHLPGFNELSTHPLPAYSSAAPPMIKHVCSCLNAFTLCNLKLNFNAFCIIKIYCKIQVKSSNKYTVNYDNGWQQTKRHIFSQSSYVWGWFY